MPSASVKLEKQGSQETLDPFQKVMSLVEKKIRNLEKRKNKLEQYRVDLEAGKELNEDQQQAVENYDCVVANLELMRDLSTQFGTILTDHNKVMKKQMKKEQIEKQQAEIIKVKEILKIQDVLQQMVQGETRSDFLAGTNGAVQMSAESLESLDLLYKLVTPTKLEGQSTQEFQVELRGAAEHLVWLLEGRNRDIANSTYKALLNVVEEISNCSYPERKLPEIEEEVTAPETEEVSEYTNGLVVEEAEEVTPISEVTVSSPVTEGPPPGLAPPTVAPMLPPPVPQETTAVSPAQEALVAAMAQMTTAAVPGASPQGAGMPPAPSYFTQSPPQPTPQPPPPQPQAPQQPPPQQTPLQPPQPPQLQPISLNDLVAPGSFDFLQESQVAQEPPTVYMDPAVVSIGSIKTDSVSQRSVSPVPQPPQQVAPMVPPNQDPTHPSSIPTQTYTNQTYNVVSYSQGVPVYPNNTVVDSTPNPPPPIPMPPQARPQEKVEFNPEASPWTGQQVPAQQTGQAISNVPQQPQEDNWGVQDVPVNGGDDKWCNAESGNWDEYEENQGGTVPVPTNGHGGDYERRGNFRSRGRGFGGRGGFRGGRGGYQNGRGGYGGYGGFRGGRGGGMGGPRGGRGFRGQGPRGNFRGRGGGYQGQRQPYQQHQQ
ncbi:caprin-1-like [Homarus americanus]|uniref:caprin-1-like n=1 Tax=Homarus americanus TaxID=6706 RepID=UPI001C45AC0D|nr:caprin-1-like [Homarus americanus]